MQYTWDINWYGPEGDLDQGYDYEFCMTTTEGIEIWLCGIKEISDPDQFTADLERFRKGNGNIPVHLYIGNVAFHRLSGVVSIEIDPENNNVGYTVINVIPYDPNMCDALLKLSQAMQRGPLNTK